MYALSIIQYPSGLFGFVGTVPHELAVEASNMGLVKAAQRCGMGIARGIAERQGGYIRKRSWETRDAALAEAARLGYEVAA